MNAPFACGLGLGSNFGDRLALIQKAAAALQEAPGVIPGSLRKAPIYASTPIHCPEGSPDFLNTVITLELDGDPRDLLRQALGIETALGRVRDGTPNAARGIDIDLLYAGDLTCHDHSLHLPHPRLHERLFVLRPLADLEPELHLPGFSVPVRALRQKVEASQADGLALFAEHW